MLAFIVDRGWQEPLSSWEDSLRPINVFGTVALICAAVFALGGWALGRMAASGLVMVLGACAVLSSAVAAASAPLWAAGTVLAAVLAAAEARSSSRQLTAIMQLAARLKDGTKVRVGPNALAAERRVLRRGRRFAITLLAVSIALWGLLWLEWSGAASQAPPSDARAFVPGAAPFAGGTTVLAVVSTIRVVWRWWAHRQMRGTVWAVPCPGGPVWVHPIPLRNAVINASDSENPECFCEAEADRRDAEGLAEWGDGMIPAQDYCPVHGIDVVNSLDHDAFRALAASRRAWLWDIDSTRPVLSGDPRSGTRDGLLAFAGHAFGGIPLLDRGGVMDAWGPRTETADERRTADGEIPHEAESDFLPPHQSGVLDVVDLAPAEMRGTAVRYRHGRAWYVP
ncbi:hypothetical protein [Sinomonas halotolerans]|uniref:Uncharacterized protein n=1 Tax=Sinomonas halotolerans TaxID=1644133 RepID=A0ABU9X0Q5_9MICC